MFQPSVLCSAALYITLLAVFRININVNRWCRCRWFLCIGCNVKSLFTLPSVCFREIGVLMGCLACLETKVIGWVMRQRLEMSWIGWLSQYVEALHRVPPLSLSSPSYQNVLEHLSYSSSPCCLQTLILTNQACPSIQHRLHWELILFVEQKIN